MQWRGNNNWLVRLPLAVVLTWLGSTALVRAQIPNLGALSSPTGLGSLAMSPGQLMGTGSSSSSTSNNISITDSFVSFIDAPVPRNTFMMRLDLGYDMPQPTRGEYYFSKGGLPGSPGQPLIETKINSLQELDSYAEYALTPWLSGFIQAPYRWVNPDVNQNVSGAGNMQYGLKLCTWSSDNIIATLQLRVYEASLVASVAPSHWSIEPGLLAAVRLTSNILLEGQVKYWMPIGGTDFAGDIVQYGIGLSYGQRQQSGFWYMPVLEGMGWTVLNGKTLLASSPDNFVIEDARGQTIINAYLGVRWGFGNLDFYAGYGRALTGDYWQRDSIRFEVRYLY